MDKIWLLVLGLGLTAVLIGAATAYVYSQTMTPVWNPPMWGMMPPVWSSSAEEGVCEECYGMMYYHMRGPVQGRYGWENQRPPYSGEETNIIPNVEITLYTVFENGRFLFKDADGNVNPTIVVKTGDKIKINVINSDGITHNIALPELGVYSSMISSKGASASIVFEATEPGEYSYFCTVPGHKEAGMIGKLIITE